MNNTLIVIAIINYVAPGATSDMMNCTRTTTLKNGSTLTTGINISNHSQKMKLSLNYALILFKYIGQYKYV